MTCNLRRLVVIVIVATGASLAPRALAQGADAAAAEVLFREGREAADAGDFRTACQKFHESHRLDPAPGTMLNIADCEERQGKLATAWTFYRAVVQKIPPSDERNALARARAEQLEPRLPRLMLELAPSAPPGSRVRRDGVELKAASLSTELPVDPGPHVIEVTAPGRAKRLYEVSLREGERVRRVVEPGAPNAEAAPETPGAEQASGSGNRTLGWVLGSVGVAGLAVGAVTGMMVLDKKSTVDENCDADKRCNQTGADAAESGRTLGTVSGVSFVVGGLALAAGAYFVLSSDEQGRPTTGLVAAPGRVTLVQRF